MATTRIIPMHLNKGKTLAQCLADRTEYGMNPDKTEGGALISAFACEPETAVSEFALSKREYRELTGRVQESDVIAYQVRQSFKPGEVTPEEANRIGYEFAKRFLKGRHAFLVCTHTDKKHIHNHIYWNSTALDCTRKFKNFIGSYRAVRRLSDLICAEHRLSVVENPQKHGLSYNKWRGGHDKLSNRDLLRMAIDAALEKQPKDFDVLLALLKSSGYSVARKGRLSLRHENQKQSIRLDSLGEGYSEQELRAVLAGGRTHKPFVKKKYPKRRERATLIADIEAKSSSQNGNLISPLKTCDRIAEETNTSKNYVIRAEHFSDGIDAAEEVLPGIKNDLLLGKYKPRETDVAAIAKAAPEERREKAEQLRVIPEKKPKADKESARSGTKRQQEVYATIDKSYEDMKDSKRVTEDSALVSLRYTARNMVETCDVLFTNFPGLLEKPDYKDQVIEIMQEPKQYILKLEGETDNEQH